jgi:hypothetical protein
MTEDQDWLTSRPGLDDMQGRPGRRATTPTAAEHFPPLPAARMLAELADEFTSPDGDPVTIDIAKPTYRHRLAIAADSDRVLAAQGSPHFHVVKGLTAAKLV